MHEDLRTPSRDEGDPGRRAAEGRAFRLRLVGTALLGLGLAAYWYGRSLGAW